MSTHLNSANSERGEAPLKNGDPLRKMDLREDDLKRFWKKVKKGAPNECWVWTGSTTQRGYGQFCIRDRRVVAHWILLPVLPDRSKGEQACHKCDNPPCVNPAHIFIGTQVDNMQDCKSKGRMHFPTNKELDSMRAKIIHFKGIEVWNHKLDTEQVRQVITSPQFHGINRHFSRMFGVSEQVISGIRKGHRWKHIERPATAIQRFAAMVKVKENL